jgi:uncharacterized membrane protein
MITHASGIVDALLAVCAAAGFAISFHFLMLHARRIDPGDARLPRVCRWERGDCERVLGHPDARLVGVPNAVPGLVYFTALLLGAAGVLPAGAWAWLEVAAWAAVAAGVYLTYSLFRRVRVRCALCLASHALNLAILLLILARPV